MVSRMTGEDAFHVFLFGLQPHLQERVGVHPQGGMEVVMELA